MTGTSRRELLKAAGVLPIAARGKGGSFDSGRAEWVDVPCPKCHLPVYFLPAQRRNRCAVCHTEVTRGLD